MTIWEDQGLYFTLIFNSIVVAVVLIVGFVMHKAQTNARALRPNRPGSQTASLYSLPTYIATIDEQVVLQSNGVQPYMYIMTLKFMTFLFAGMCITSVVIVSMCATDDQLNRFNASTDPDECYPKSKVSCDDAPRCSWDSLAARCVPLIRHGLFDLSAANLGEGDASWRLYLFAIFSVACCIPLFIALRAFATAMRDTIEHANTRPAFSGFKYGAMATVGARTVMIAGLPKDAKVLTDPALFHAYLIAEQETRKTLLEDRVEKPKDDDDAEKAKADGPKTTDVPAEPRPNDNSFDVAKPSVPTPKSELAVLASPAERSAEEAGEPFPSAVADLTAPSWLLAAHVALDSICIIRQAPDDLMDLIEAEKEALTLLADAVAAEKLEKDEEKKPVMVRAGCKKVPGIEHRLSELAKVRDEMEPKLDERATQDMTGAVMMTFDRASTAFAFVRQFNAEQGVVSFVEAQVVGPRESIIWANLSVVGPVAKVRGVVMIAIFVTLVFFWGIPVGFLGSLSNLETLPGIGSAFASAFAPIPVTVLGTLSAYLPTIVITVFNILLPSLFRFFGRLGGLKTTDAETRSVLLMCAVFSIMSGIVMQAALQGGFAQAMALISNPSGDAVRALIIAIVSPSGGYWYVYLLSAACLGLGIRFLDLGAMIGSFILGKLASRQEEYDKLFDPRPTDFAFVTGRHIFFAAIGLLFHGTVAFLQPFATMYSGAAYFVERSLMLDAGCRDKVQMVDYSYALTGFHCILCLHTVASVGNVIIAALKLSIGAPIIAGVGIFVSLGMHVYVRRVLADTIFLTPERVLAIEKQAEAEGLKQQPRSDSKPYVPDYATHTIDRGAVDRIQALEFPEVDKSWPKTANSPEAVEVVVA